MALKLLADVRNRLAGDERAVQALREIRVSVQSDRAKHARHFFGERCQRSVSRRTSALLVIVDTG